MKKRNHYIPRFYLRLFSPDGSHVWIHTKNNPPEKKGIGLAGSQRGLYDEKTEEQLERLIEGTAAVTLRNVLQSRSINAEQKRVLARFISSMLRRVPQHKNMAVDPTIQKLANEYLANIDEGYILGLVGLRPEHLLMMSPQEQARTKAIVAQKLQEARAQLQETLRIPDRVYYLFNVLRPSALDDVLIKMGWHFFEAVDAEFVTSDDPLVAPTTGALRKGAQMVFPLSKTVCLVASAEQTTDCWTTAQDEQVRHLNRRIVAHAYLQVFAATDQLSAELTDLIASAQTFHRRSA